MSNSKKKPGRSKFSFGSGSRKGFVSRFQDKDTEKESENLDSTSINTLEKIDVIYKKSSESMSELNANSIALTVTSPPYNIDKDSDRASDKNSDKDSKVIEVSNPIKRKIAVEDSEKNIERIRVRA